jgi:hypothetical protein
MKTSQLGVVVCLLAVGLAGCSSQDKGVRITAEKPAAPAAPPARPRSEPVFYNGKTYNLDFAPSGGGAFAMVVKGMSGKQQKDAVAVATSSLRYFNCPEGQTGLLTNQPVYVGTFWKMNARCG